MADAPDLRPDDAEFGMSDHRISGDRLGFSYDGPEPRVFLQWKGTNVCMDFYCECGAHCHFDGDFAYVVQCPHCMTKWEMPFTLFPRRLITGSEAEKWHGDHAKLMQPDKDMEDQSYDE